MSGFDSDKMSKTLREKLNTYEKLRAEGRTEEASTKLLEALKYSDYILREAEKELEKLNKEIPGLPKELVGKIPKPTNVKPLTKKFIIIPKQILPF